MLSKTVTGKLQSIKTPFYLYDMDLLRRTVFSAYNASVRFGYKVHYALKANFDPRILQMMREYSFGVDCVSGNEVRFAIENGFGGSDIVFAGVGKTDDEIVYGLQNNIFAFNCESAQELEVINLLASQCGVVADVALRINPDIDPMTHKHISTGMADNKFGISYKEVDLVIAKLPEYKNINITGLHFHIGSQITHLDVFRQLCRRVNGIYSYFCDKGLKLSHINLGGGLGIEYRFPDCETIPDFESFFALFNSELKVDKELEIHFELGRSLVGQCGELISRVLFTKATSTGKKLVILDASMTELMRPALYGAEHAIDNLAGGNKTEIVTIAGPVCESTDTFARDYEIKKIKRGDLVSIKSAGAYGQSMANRYNMHDLPRVIYSDQL